MNGAMLFLLAFLGVMVFVVIAAVLASRRSPGASLLRDAHLHRLAAELGLTAGAPFLVERDGRSFTAKYTPGTKNTPATLRITASVDEVSDAAAAGAYRESGRTHVALRPAIVLRRETGTDRLGKRLGLNREVQLGDPAFDASVYLETNSPETDVQSTLADASLRAAVRALLDEGSTRVVLDDVGLSAVRDVSGGARMDAATFERTAALLAQAGAALPLFNAGQVTKAPTQVGAVLTMVAAFMLMPIGLVLGDRPPIGSGVTLGVAAGLGLWAVLAIVLVGLLRGRSDSLRRLGLMLMPTLFALPMLTNGAAIWVNRELDTSPPTDHAGTVLRMWTTRPKNTTYYHLDVTSWRPGEAPVKLNVSGAFAAQATQGRAIVVTTHAGKLGWEWVDRFRLPPREGQKP